MASMEELNQALDNYRRGDVLELLRQNVMDECPESEKGETYSRILALRDMQLAAEIVRKENAITADMLQLDYDNHHNREFTARLMKQYNKKLDMAGEEAEQAFFEIACRVGNTSMIASMIRSKKATAKYPLLASGSEAVFALVDKIDRGSLGADLRVALLFEAATAPDAVRRLNDLSVMGFDVTEKNSEGKNLRALMEERVASNRYTRNRNGELKRKQDRSVISYIDKISVTPPSKEKEPLWTKLLPAAITVLTVVIVIVVGALFWGSRSGGGDADGKDAATDQAGAADETDAAGAMPGLATDTSLVVEDGDQVNIDYVGYIDDVAFDGGNTQGQGADLVIGSHSYIDDFEEQLIGHHVGDHVTVEVTFPETYDPADMRGKDARFEVDINGIYQ